tara:strand:+ start:1810 stop:2535 length:726 start_codon:yes stop_codon:yes gene_type:complete
LNNYKIEISYDGSLFYGFQKQLNLRTVQSEIEGALNLIVKDYELTYAGRTDAGVHARSQILSLKINENLKTSFFSSLDSLLGHEIKIKKFQKVKTSFHPRFQAKSRVYKYFLQANDRGNPYNRNYSYLVKTPMDLNQLKLIEKIFLGKKNFKSYSKLRKGQDPYREILRSKWSNSNDYFIYTIEGNAFLHNMVRSIVGCQLAMLEGKVTKKELRDSLQQPRETRFNFIAPAHGLYLWKIKY